MTGLLRGMKKVLMIALGLVMISLVGGVGFLIQNIFLVLLN